MVCLFYLFDPLLFSGFSLVFLLIPLCKVHSLIPSHLQTREPLSEIHCCEGALLWFALCNR